MNETRMREFLRSSFWQVALPIVAGTLGTVFYVDSVTGSASYTGRSARDPVASIDTAVGLCTANKGDVIVVMPGHTETVIAANGIDLDVAGITVICQGNGSLRPTVTFTTATTATLRVNAANVKVQGLRLVCGIDSQVKMIDVNADYSHFEGCDFIGASTTEFLSGINIATTKDFCRIIDCRFEQPTDPTGTDGAADTGCIYCVDTEWVWVEGCRFNGMFETAAFHNRTTAMKYLTWKNNTVNNILTIAAGNVPRRLKLVAGTVGCSIGPDTDFVPGLGYRVQKTEDGATVAGDDLFSVSGKVMVTVWSWEVTNALGATAKFSDYKVGISGGADFCAAGDISSAAIGYIGQLNSDSGDTALAETSHAVSVVKTADTNAKGIANRIVGLDGLAAITLASTRTAGDSGDALIHSIWYMPLEPGAGVVPVV